MLTRRLFAAPMSDELALAEQASARLAELGPTMPDAAAINAIAGAADANLASRVLYEALLRDPGRGAFIREIDAALVGTVAVQNAPLLIIVPGMFYREYPEIGADGELIAGIATKFGLNVLNAPTSSLGSIRENLEILHNFLTREVRRDFWLVSMSRGSAEVKWLLQR
ncbi:MAG: hypothetical protein KJO82_01520, partial [Gammaproteobacteria bacterium]|nr:hypothetical protein [Gammaproteobacteria bacterium]